MKMIRDSTRGGGVLYWVLYHWLLGSQASQVWAEDQGHHTVWLAESISNLVKLQIYRSYSRATKLESQHTWELLFLRNYF